MSILTWIIFGAVVGIVANMIDPRPSKGGLLGAIVLGIIGAIIGGFLGSLLLGIEVTGFNLSSLFVAVGGALLVLFVRRAF
ncbi:MAG: hypothetical protein ACD_50C00152G0013 [uncultured bacterium]|nr:MAG: hypothetical protein ACD_50C00152G0013 [uncultured bacterium]OGH14892.1 MAG: hypothetical protein A2687_04570 [Candidatus Levybacteria bacterium RIFCSPHIGHO2_01_FULL_38_26]